MNKANTNTESGVQSTGVEQETSDARPVSEAHNTPVAAENQLNLNSRVDDLAKERDTLLDRLARMQADFENSRKRMEKEQQEYRDFALTDALQSLLPSLDSLDWALQTPVENPADFRGGVELIRKQLQDALEKLGLTAISARGEPFDPHYHDAVDIVDTPQSPPNTVVDEVRRGYKLKDRLLRPAMVLVSGNSPQRNKR
jgi:molecular chaperone GrpE